jgi:hypothetical protein
LGKILAKILSPILSPILGPILSPILGPILGPVHGSSPCFVLCRSQPDDSVPLCKYGHVYKLSTQSISKEMNNDNELKFA